jgi:non-specific serine/threonine protein kinase
MAWLQSNFARAVACHRRALEHYTAAGDETMAAQARHDMVVNAIALGRREDALALNQENIDYFRRTGDWLRLANSLNTQGLIKQIQGDLHGAMDTLEMALDIAQRFTSSDQSWLPAGIQSNLGQTELLRGNLERAEVLLERSLREFNDFSPWAVDTMLGLGRLREAQGRLLESRQLAVESLSLATENNYRDYVADGLEQLAFVWSKWGDAARAARLLGAAAALRKRFGAPNVRDQMAYYVARLPLVRAALPDAQFAAEWEAGWLLNRDEAIELAAADPPPTERAGQGDASGEAADPLAELTPRERVVALLMARGKTNQQIADELYVTIKTVEKHAGNALGKLDFRSRVELAAWVAGAGLLDS